MSLSDDIILNLIKKQDISETEINRICNKLNKIWLQTTDCPKKYSIPAHEAEILIRAMQLKLRKESQAKG